MTAYPTRILFAGDGSEGADLAARAAADIARMTGAELHVLTVGPGYPYYELPDSPLWFKEIVDAQRRDSRELLDDQVARIEAAGATVADTHLREGDRKDSVIVEVAEKAGADLMVVGSRGLGRLKRVLLGSVSSSVTKHANCPVLVVRGGWGADETFLPGKILLALDGSQEADTAAMKTVELANRTGSELHLIHVGRVAPVYHPEQRGYGARYDELRAGAQGVLDEQAEKVRAMGGKIAGSHLGMGRPDEEIVDRAEDLGARLIAVGSRGLEGTRRALLGSVSGSVVRHAHCSVLVVREG
jgi:nucleotide-binding universal stress UspA family protein